jgi:FkbM family methyltransferase
MISWIKKVLIRMKIRETIQTALNLRGIYVSRETPHPNALSLLTKYQITCQSILHIGGHFAEEAAVYAKSHIRHAIFIEGDPETFNMMQRALEQYPHFDGVCALLSDKFEKLDFHVASNKGASSSILLPDRHLLERPEITFEVLKKLDSVTLDSLRLGEFDLIVLDVQGAEHQVIKGGFETLKKAKAIWAEVNAGFMYEGDSDSSTVVALLSEYFVPVYMNMNKNKWGDALFIHRSLVSGRIKRD